MYKADFCYSKLNRERGRNRLKSHEKTKGTI